MAFDDIILMPLIIFCEKCNFHFEVIAFTKPDGTTDGQKDKCPRCGHWNGGDNIKEFLERLKK